MKDSKLDTEAYAAARLASRQAANELQDRFESEGKPFGWFEALYARADGERAAIPWADAAPRFKLEAWLSQSGLVAGHAADIGCGLGDNAKILSAQGWTVTAFDLSGTAISWARKRMADQFPAASIEFHTADLFDLPSIWRGAFELVHETYNLQALPRDKVADATRHIATLAAPGGTVVVITRARDRDEVPDGPPWPLSRDDLDGFCQAGLDEIQFEEFFDQRDDPVRHFLAVYRRAHTKGNYD